MQKIKLQRSMVLTAVLVVAHGSAIALVTLVDMPLWLELMVWVALVLNCAVSVRHAALLLAPDSTVAIEVTSDHRMSIQTRDLKWHECKVLGSTYVSSMLTVVNLRRIENEAIGHIVILPDAIDAEDYRYLRVWLRWSPANEPER